MNLFFLNFRFIMTMDDFFFMGWLDDCQCTGSGILVWEEIEERQNSMNNDNLEAR